jgi:hypothetical protein
MTFYLAEAGRTVRPYGELKATSCRGAPPNGSLSILRGLYRTLAAEETHELKFRPKKTQNGSALFGASPMEIGIHVRM